SDGAICRKRRAVEVDRCAREGVWDRAPVSRSRPAACRADRWPGICRQARPGECAKASRADEEGGKAAIGSHPAAGRADRFRRDKARKPGKLVQAEQPAKTAHDPAVTT